MTSSIVGKHARMQRRLPLILGAYAILMVAILILKSALLIFSIGVSLALFLLITEREALKRLQRLSAIALIFMLMAVLPLLIEQTDLDSKIVYWSWGSWGITSDSIERSFLVAARCFASYICLLYLICSCPIHMMAAEMRRRKFPKLFVELFELIYRYLHVLSDTATQIRIAQRSRLGYRGFQNRFKHSALLIGQTLVLSNDEADKLYNGLLSRGFDDALRQQHLLPNTPTPPLHEEKNLIELKGIRACYDKRKEVLKGIDLKISKGEKIALLGANGAGKSTLFLLLNGIISPSKGELLFHGKTIEGKAKQLANLRSELALVFQNSNHQLFTPSVADELAFGLRNIGYEGEQLDQKVEQYLDQFELQELRHKAPHKLSDGQKKWLALAAVLAIDPQVIILDEPCSNLDCLYTAKVLNLMDELHEQGKTLILSTHDMDMAYEWADRVIVLSDGRVLADASVEEVFANHELLAIAHLASPRCLRRETNIKKKVIDAPRLKPQSSTSGLMLYIRSHSLNALVVGAGAGAKRKVQSLVQAGVPCTVIAPNAFERFSPSELLKLHARTYIAGDTEGYNLVVAATGDYQTDRAIRDDGLKHGALCSTLSDASESSFHFVASGAKEGIALALHTDYKLPELAVALRNRFLSQIPEDLSQKLTELAELRNRYIDLKETESSRSAILQQSYKAKLDELIKTITT